MQDPIEVVRHHQAALVAILARHGESMPRRVWLRISATADELPDRAVLPALLPPEDPIFDDPQVTVAEAVEALRSLIPRVDPMTALACGRAVVGLVDAQRIWPGP